MRDVALVNVPFAGVERPAISLAQLRTVVQRQNPQVVPQVFYLNLDFAKHLGLDNYQLIANQMEALVSGLGEWFFRPAAFPDQRDNSELYLQRYLRPFGAQQETLLKMFRDVRPTVTKFLDATIDRYELDQYRIVGATSTFQQNVASFALARRIKQRNPGVVTVMGGANCEAPMGGIIAKNVDVVDFVFSGPALANFPEFVARVLAGDVQKCHDMKGVFSKQRIERQGNLAKEFGDELPIDVEVPVDYDDYFAALDASLPSAGVPVSLLFETSRGCWWGAKAHCTFCGLNGATMAYRGMTPAKARQHLDHLFTKYGDKVARFEAVDNIMSKEYLTDVFPHLRAPKPVFYEVKADLSSRDMEVLAQAGVRQIQPGIEALATSTLKLMRKGTSAFQNIRFLQGCLVNGIAPMWNLLVGFPGETGETYAKYVADLPSLVHLPPPSGAYPVRFDRFSPYFNSAKEYGLTLKPYDFYEMIYPFPRADLDDFAYYFMDTNFKAPYFTEMVRWLGKVREPIAEWRRRWMPGPDVPRPRLTFEGRGTSKVVFDSRSGTPVEHRLDATTLRVLEAVTEARRIAVVATELQLPQSEVMNHLDRLAELRLVFREGDQYISLVTGQPPSGQAVDRAVRDAHARQTSV